MDRYGGLADLDAIYGFIKEAYPGKIFKDYDYSKSGYGKTRILNKNKLLDMAGGKSQP